jgi:hypothetical protein
MLHCRDLAAFGLSEPHPARPPRTAGPGRRSTRTERRYGQPPSASWIAGRLTTKSPPRVFVTSGEEAIVVAATGVELLGAAGRLVRAAFRPWKSAAPLPPPARSCSCVPFLFMEGATVTAYVESLPWPPGSAGSVALSDPKRS